MPGPDEPSLFACILGRPALTWLLLALPRRIRVNSTNPGSVETEDLAHSYTSQGKDATAFNTPLGRIRRLDDSSWVTGETHTIAGGLHGWAVRV